jgi:4-amino-4-deoxy-L-arabinose transferase-like glycosyltransferase
VGRIAMKNGTRVLAIAAGATLAMLVLGAATRLDPVPLGLNTRYFANLDEAEPAAGARLDTQPSTAGLIRQWIGSPPASFSQRWTGAITSPRDGTYLFAIDSDGPASLLIDGQIIAASTEARGARRATGTVSLTAGAHPMLMHYSHPEGSVLFALLWAHDGSSLAAVPAGALRPSRIRSGARLTARAFLDRALALSQWIWVASLLLVVGAVAWTAASRIRARLQYAGIWPGLKWILGASVILNIAGIWWGLPGNWVAIELRPVYVLDGLSHHFSHGWYDAYPPVHFYLLTAAWSPLLLLDWLGRLNLDDTAMSAAMVAISRFVSLILASGIVVAACVCGARAFGRRAGIAAAAIVALAAPFVYYAKTGNVDVPYLFWWAASMVFYLRLLEDGRLGDYVAFAAAATLSVCTKDQAYGLYILPPVAIVAQIWSVNRRAGVRYGLARALVDRRLIAAAGASAALFFVCHNLLFNLDGFMEHVRYIAGPGSETYRVYEPTAAGRLALLRQTIRLIEISMGWPLFLAGVFGVALAMSTARLRLMTVWLLVPVVSYYFGFINVILYNYDRFVLPMCFVLALFGGLTIDRLLFSNGRLRHWAAAVVALAFSYSVLYAATVDVLMIGDSRYAAERWMHAQIGRGELVAVSELREYLPRIDDFNVADINTVAELEEGRPAYVVLNADYVSGEPASSPWGQLISGLHHGELGYRLVARFRRPSPWPWLPGAHPDLVGARRETVVFSTLRNINPTIEIFRRER